MNLKRKSNTKKINNKNYKFFIELHLQGYTNEQISDVLDFSMSTISRMKRYYNKTHSLEYNKETK